MSRLFFIIVLGLCFAGFSQNRGDLWGKVIDSKKKQPIPFASVEIVSSNQKTKTDINGNFVFRDIAYSTISIRVSMSVYDTLTMPVNISQDSLYKTFYLTSSGQKLKTITVDDGKGSQYSTIRKMRPIEGVLISKGKKTEVISLEQMNTNKSVNLGRQIYAKIPGLNIWESDGAGIQLGIGGRGLSPTRTSNFNTRQNGYDISADALGYPESYYTPPAEAVQEIQLIRGAASLQFGTQFGGLLNFVLKKGPEDKPFELVARHTIGSFGLNSSFLSVGGSEKTWNYYAYYQYKFGDDWRPFSQFKVHSGGAQVSKYLTDKSKITLDLTKMYYIAQQPGGIKLVISIFETDPTIVNRERELV